MPLFEWCMSDKRPCITFLARMISPPNAWPIAWCPKHTPNNGIFPAKCWMAGIEIPASEGEHGPGPITRYLGCHRSISSNVTASLRTTFTSWFNQTNYLKKIFHSLILISFPINFNLIMNLNKVITKIANFELVILLNLFDEQFRLIRNNRS